MIRKITLLLFLISALSHSQYWLKIDSVFSPFGVTVQSFSSPDFCDIDADGDLDLFVGTLGDDRVAFFRNIGSSMDPVFRRDTNLLASIYADGYQYTNADYPALADLDNDNDYDLVIGGFSKILLYWNIGDSVTPVWSKDTSLMASINTMIGTDARPAFADLDGDGDQDLVVGIGESFYGDVTPGVTIAFRNNGTPSTPEFITDNTLVNGIPDVGLNAYPYFKDMDNDGDLDLIMGRDLQTMLYYKNTGTPQSPVWTSTPALVSPLETTHYWKQPAVCDLDGDGDNDLVYGTDDGSMLYYQNTGTPSTPVLTRNTAYFQMIRIDGGASTTSLADFDNDGDLDLISGEQLGKFHYFRNDGNSAKPDFKKTTAPFTSIDAGSYSSPRFIDIDNDGDYDIVSGALDGKIYCYINNGGSFTQNTSIFSGIDVGWQSAPSFADLNNDGFIDMIVTGEVAAEATFFKNNGSNVFAADNSFLSGITIPSYSYPCFVDLDDDGDIDLVFGRSNGSLVLYENTGTPNFPVWQVNSDVFPDVKVRQSSTPAFADLDGDGMKDLIIGEYSGNFSFFKNMLPTDVSDAAPAIPVFSELEQNFPNPFNPVTTIRFSLAQSGRASLRIFDLIGREVAVLVDDELSRGNHAVQWNASDLPTGVYVYTLRSDNTVRTRKLVVMK